MSNSLTVFEKYSQYWPVISVGSILLSGFFLLAYILVSDVLVSSYLRLGAFAFFVVGFLGLFKVKDGQIRIDYRLKETNPAILEIIYSVKDRKIHAETIELSGVEDIKIDEMPNRTLYNDFYKVDKSVRFKKKDINDWLYLNEKHGRVIPLSKKNAEKIKSFLETLV